MKKDKKMIPSIIFMAAANIIFAFTLWLLTEYDKVRFDQVLYQFKTSAAGSDTLLVIRGVAFTAGLGALLCALDTLIYFLLSGRFAEKLKNNASYIKFSNTKLSNFFKRRFLPLSLCLLSFSAVFFVSELRVFAYLSTNSTESDFIEENYASPDNVVLTFPQEKRNLIYIFLESMENSYADKESGGIFEENYIKELTELAQKNISFSDSEKLGGAYEYSGATWTAGAMVSQTAGIPVKVPLEADSYGGDNRYMPGIISIGQILEKQGYRQLLLLGSDAEYACRDSYFTEHGNYEIIDIKALKAQGRLPENYKQWWGFEDEKLFEFAKQEITRLAESGEPFNFTMLTADTHFPDGYSCRLCPQEFDEQYANVIACSSKQVSEFVSWIQEQPFYENTTIVLSGDHLTMDPQFMSAAQEDYSRTTYNCFINSAARPVMEKSRRFGSFDMLPTTLAALGVRIEGERLGLGTNLFSDTPTLTEKYGYDVFDSEIQKKSNFYNTHFLGLEE